MFITIHQMTLTDSLFHSIFIISGEWQTSSLSESCPLHSSHKNKSITKKTVDIVSISLLWTNLTFGIFHPLFLYLFTFHSFLKTVTYNIWYKVIGWWKFVNWINCVGWLKRCLTVTRNQKIICNC